MRNEKKKYNSFYLSPLANSKMYNHFRKTHNLINTPIKSQFAVSSPIFAYQISCRFINRVPRSPFSRFLMTARQMDSDD